MRDLIWIAALSAVLAGVWFFMARLDELLKGSAPQEPEAAGLRLGVERGLDAGRLDAIFLRSGQARGAVLLWRAGR